MNAKYVYLKGKVKKKARKYFHVDVYGSTRNLLICDSTKDLKPGDEVGMYVLSIYKQNSPSWEPSFKCFAPLDSAEAQAEFPDMLKRHIEKCRKEIDEDGSFSTKDIEALRALGATQEIIDELKAAHAKEQHEREVYRYVHRIKRGIREGVLYEGGIEALRKLGEVEKAEELRKQGIEAEYDRDVERIRIGIEKGRKETEILDRLRRFGCNETVAQLEDEWAKKEKELKANAPKKPYICTCSIGYSKARHLTKGSLYEHKGKLYEVLSKKYFGEDGLSFGAGEDEYYDVDLMLLDEDDDRVIKYRAHQAELAQARQKRQAKTKAIQKLSASAEKGDLITESSLAELVKDATVLSDTFDIYGGGEMLLLKDGELYYLINNGGDGASWQRNAITTGGAGAYGYHTPMTPELEESVKILTEGVSHE